MMREMLNKVLECICLHKGFHSPLGLLTLFFCIVCFGFTLYLRFRHFINTLTLHYMCEHTNVYVCVYLCVCTCE